METTQESCELFWTNPGSDIQWNNSCTVTHLPSQKSSKQDEQATPDTAVEAKMNPYGPQHRDVQYWPTSKNLHQRSANTEYY